MYNNFSETQTQITGIDVAGSVEQFVNANQVIDRAKRGTYAYDLFTWADQAEAEKEAVKQPARRVGAPALSKERMEYIRAAICTNTPAQKGLSSRAWTVSAIRDLVEKEYGITVSNSTARNYARKFGMAAPRPLNRSKGKLNFRTNEWMVEQFPIVKERAKAANQKIVWLTCQSLSGDGLFASGIAVHAVANSTGKASWLVMPEHNRLGVLADLFDAIGADNGEKPLVLFDSSVSVELKTEIQAFLHVKHEGRKDGGGKTKKKVANSLNTGKWLSKILGSKADFFPIGVHELEEEDECIEAIEKMLAANHAMHEKLANPDAFYSENFLEITANDLISNKVGSDVYEDAFEWLTSECDLPKSFVWSTRIQGADPDLVRAGFFLEIAQSPKIDAEKRKEMLFWHSEYQ